MDTASAIGGFIIEFFAGNFFTLVILAGLVTVMFANKSENIKGTKLIGYIIGLMLILVSLLGFEDWVVSERRDIRLLYFKTLLEYWLYAIIMMLEYLVMTTKNLKRVHLIPLVIDIAVTVTACFGNRLVFWYDRSYTIHTGPLEVVPYITAGVYILLLVYSSKQFYSKGDHPRGSIILYISAAVIIACLFELLDIRENMMDEVASIATLVFYLYLSTVHHREVGQRLKDQEIMIEKSRAALMQSQLRLMQAQIQPHFIFNSLMAIQAQCLTDPDEVYNSIGDFAGYLRANLDAMTDTRLITFEQELDNIESYLNLEKINYGDRLRVEYDLQIKGFMLPALTVQPLVENAVRHGIGPHEKGGLIVISTYEEGDNIVICIKDDGSGASSMTQQQHKRRGIGLENVRNRLAMTQIGSVEIVQTDEGTSAMIYIKNSRKEREQ
ncbi:MAG: histidine kinase [Ruminococcus sp.]|nr:histidine kinase [Ruminococcus sp.]